MAEAARELGADPEERGFGLVTMTVGARQWSPTPQGVSAGGRSRPLGCRRTGRVTVMDSTDEDDELDIDEEGPP